MEIEVGDIVLCKFYFSDLKRSKNRPVLVFKEGLPFDDFVALPLSSKTDRLRADELLVDQAQLQTGALPVVSKLILRKAFVVSKQNPIKRYARVNRSFHEEVKTAFCRYFEC